MALHRIVLLQLHSLVYLILQHASIYSSTTRVLPPEENSFQLVWALMDRQGHTLDYQGSKITDCALRRASTNLYSRYSQVISTYQYSKVLIDTTWSTGYHVTRTLRISITSFSTQSRDYDHDHVRSYTVMVYVGHALSTNPFPKSAINSQSRFP